MIFGTLFLQQFATLYEYDYSANTQTLSMYLSDTCYLYDTYIGKEAFTPMVSSPFSLLNDTSKQLFVNTDEFHYKTTIGGALGFEGLTQFQASLLGQHIFTYQADCNITRPGVFAVSCENEPVLASNYFNNTVFYNESNTVLYEKSEYAGYVTSGGIYDAPVCLVANATQYFCSVSNYGFYSASNVYEDHWNYGSQANAGTIGFGRSSPVW